MRSAWTGLLAIAALALRASQGRPDTVIRTTSRLVEVRVMADSKGNPVTDLRKKELQLQDNRKPQAIFSFTIRLRHRERRIQPGVA
jgi:hypothetical protein